MDPRPFRTDDEGDSPLPPSSPLRSLSPSFQGRRGGGEHSVQLFPTSPILSPSTLSRPGTPTTGYLAQYGGFTSEGGRGGGGGGGNREDEYEKSTLLDDLRRGDYDGHEQEQEEGEEKKEDGLLSSLVTIVAAVIGFMLLFSILSNLLFAPTTRRSPLSTRLTPYLPASFFALIGSTPPGVQPSAHPILPLLISAKDQWSTLLSTQSTTFHVASRVYRTRYGRSPPPGFDKWFAFATQGRNHTLVDEYDSMMADLLPFRDLSPEEIARRTLELAQVPGISIVSIRKGKAQVHSKSGRWAPALAFQQMIEAFVMDLPDMDIAINEKPEGRVLPRQERKVIREEYGLEEEIIGLNMTDPMITPSLQGFKAEWQRDGTVWDSFRRSCPPDSSSRRLVESIRSAESGIGSAALVVQGRASSKTAIKTRRRSLGVALPPARELTFNRNLDAIFDVCARPSTHALHSAFFSDQRSIEYLYPVFSPSKPAGFADILIPSHHYWAPSSEFTYEWDLKRGRSNEAMDKAWEDKSATIYWRGKVTRGADTPPGHAASFQKQRLVKMANEVAKEARVLVAFDPQSGALSSTAVAIAEVNQMTTDIAMACDPNLGECAYLRTLGLRVEPPEPLSSAWKHKYVLDLDEIGFSPSFLALMESKSAVVKSSMQREFWQGWTVPWKHYIPLSSAYAELFNIQTFFSGFPAALYDDDSIPLTITTLTEPKTSPVLPIMSDGTPFEGDRALQDIAEAGSEWRESHVRKADMECYVYRLMIEWAAILGSEEEEEGS